MDDDEKIKAIFVIDDDIGLYHVEVKKGCIVIYENDDYADALGCSGPEVTD